MMTPNEVKEETKKSVRIKPSSERVATGFIDAIELSIRKYRSVFGISRKLMRENIPKLIKKKGIIFMTFLLK